ncbi:MAG: histidine kinase, partial [Hydrococcus sp. CSU_1_8]|nr:histidine kinase [Hydrococcus sp. CSU_1_8]
MLATQVNYDSRFFRIKQRQAKRFQICEYHAVFLPTIRQKPDGRFVVTSRYMNLLQPKQETRSHCTGLHDSLGHSLTALNFQLQT